MNKNEILKITEDYIKENFIKERPFMIRIEG